MTDKVDDGGPAFPGKRYTGQVEYVEGVGNRYIHEPTEGMSLRDYFAAKAMASLLGCGVPSKATADTFKDFSVAEYISTQAYEMADEMLKARES